ncbi:MAG: polysaccharide biosynthesis C-terminal domain-containing protein, partial [Oscillospiraceae bacterium]|nr:polysaccharide biosynthesis C-terminal domain-containing protein [Oscillospiraceae bacterium]
SFAIKIYNMYQQCAMSVSGVLLPTVTTQLIQDATPRRMEDLVIKYGRVQWSFLSALLAGLICFGREFFDLWLSKNIGQAAVDCWLLCLILVIPMTLPLVTNVCLTILRAKNLMRFRTLSLGYSVIVNIILTLVGTYFWGYWAAALGTTFSTVIGSVISMNIYYHRKLGMNMTRVYKGIMKRITLCPLTAAIPGVILNLFWKGTWVAFVGKIAVFMVVFAFMLWTYGFSKDERNLLLRRRKTPSVS